MEEKIKQSLKEEIEVLKELLSLLDDQHKFISFKKTFELDKIAIDIEEKCKELAQKEMARRNLIGDSSMKEFVANAKDEELKAISLTTNMLNILNPDRTPKTYGPYGRR
ncbi:flagellar protein FlgN [Clostridium botulinum]|nr:flagellar protein FlgN [Clostridium botulinum]